MFFEHDNYQGESFAVFGSGNDARNNCKCLASRLWPNRSDGEITFSLDCNNTNFNDKISSALVFKSGTIVFFKTAGFGELFNPGLTQVFIVEH